MGSLEFWTANQQDLKNMEQQINRTFRIWDCKSTGSLEHGTINQRGLKNMGRQSNLTFRTWAVHLVGA